MARTINQIYAAIIAEKNTMGTLTGLQPTVDTVQDLLANVNSPSRVAEWRLWAFITAVALWTHETLWDLFSAEVDDRISKFRPGTLRWYQEQAFAFQYTDLLVWNTTTRKYEYPTIDATKQVVSLCSVTEPAGVVRIKVANLANNVVSKLTDPQVDALNAYFRQIKYPGPLVCVSYDADKLRIGGFVKFDPLADPLTVRSAVEAAVNSYITGLEFDGRFIVNRLIDKVQAVPGVIDFTDVNVYTQYGNLPFTYVDGEYQTNAGYAKVDPADPLANTLIYVPYV